MTTLTVERDPETGLALLPEGYIWRVVSTSSQYLDLKLIHEKYSPRYYSKWIFWKEEFQFRTETTIDHDYFDVLSLPPHLRTKEGIGGGLATLSDKLYKEWSRKREQDALLYSFTGDYPPNNLNSV